MRGFAWCAAAAWLYGLGAGEARADEQKFIAIGTGGPTGVYFVVGQAICRMLHKEAAQARKEGRDKKVRCSAPATGGSVYNVRQVARGELDFGVAQSDVQYDAYHGENKFAGKPVRKLRAVFALHSEPFQIVVGADSGIERWRDLVGKKVNIGNPTSGQRATMETLMRLHETRRSDFKIATELTSSEQSKALCDGKIDAFGYSVGVPNAGVSYATDSCGARIISLDGPAEKELVLATPYFSFYTIPKGAYKTTVTDVATFAVRATLVTSADVADDMVYDLVRAVLENLEDFKRLHPSLADLTPEMMARDLLTAPLHPGALRYFEETGAR